MAMIAGVITGACTAICSLVYAFGAYNWFAAEHKTAIINREYGTKYTQAEVFYASDVIDTVRVLNRNRSEISLDIKQDRKP